jgi:hypothetical protein
MVNRLNLNWFKSPISLTYNRFSNIILMWTGCVLNGKEGNNMGNFKKILKAQAAVSPAGLFKSVALVSLITILILNDSQIYSASACNPVSAILCAAVDDYADIWINDSHIDVPVTGYFPYCDKNWACSPTCISLTPAQLALLTDTNNYIAVKDQNTAVQEMWASWSLDIICSSPAGAHVQISSQNRPVDMHYDPSCTVPAPDLPLNGGLTWYDPNYNESTSGLSWVTPVTTVPQWGKRLYDPSTGNVLNALNYTTTNPNTACGAMWFRESFDLTPNPTPAPPAFTIIKSASQVHQIAGNQKDTFTLHICNTGGGTQGAPIVITDSWISSDNWQFQGMVYGGSDNVWSFTDPVAGAIAVSGSDPNRIITFSDGLQSGTCYDLSFILETWNATTQCYTWNNTASLYCTVVPTETAISTIVLDDYCPSVTFTPTISPTRTITPTTTPTRTITPTWTNSPVYTPTNTPIASATFTLTVTPTSTPPPMVIQLTKTISENIVMLGDTFTYCIAYNNVSGGNATFRIWDTIPAPCDYVGSNPVGTVIVVGSSNIIYWDFSNIPNNGTATVCFYVKAARLPFLKLDEFLAWIDDRESYMAYYAAGG